MSMNHKQVVLKRETYERLSEIRHPGQSYTGIILELIENREGQVVHAKPSKIPIEDFSNDT